MPPLYWDVWPKHMTNAIKYTTPRLPAVLVCPIMTADSGEQARPEYKGEFIPSPIDGKTIL